jgi:hypothetical protein
MDSPALDCSLVVAVAAERSAAAARSEAELPPEATRRPEQSLPAASVPVCLHPVRKLMYLRQKNSRRFRMPLKIYGVV